VAWSTFENVDSGLEDSYLTEEIPPTRIEDGVSDFTEKVNSFIYSVSVSTRDVSAVIRDAELRLRKYKDVGGSILYVVTSNESETNDTVTETNMAEKLLLNNIKLIAAESGPNFMKDLFRVSVLSQGSHYFTPQWDNTFTAINTEILNDCQNSLKIKRRMVYVKIYWLKIIYLTNCKKISRLLAKRILLKPAVLGQGLSQLMKLSEETQL
jgi:hypothetical protein